MALSPKQRADLLALALGEPPASASAPVAVAAVAKPSITPTQPEPKPAAEAVAPAAPVAKRVPNSVMVALREAAAERSQASGPSLPPGIRPEFAHKPMAKVRPGFGPASPLREGQPDLARAQLLWEIAQADRAAERRQMRALDPVGLGHWGSIDD